MKWPTNAFLHLKVLDANPAHVKALYRRGMAYMAVGNFEEARADFSKVQHHWNVTGGKGSHIIIYLPSESVFLVLDDERRQIIRSNRKCSSSQTEKGGAG